MRPFPLLLAASAIAVPALSSANTLWVSSSSNELPKESIGYADVGTVYVPGSVNTATGVATPGMQFQTVSIGDVNGDGVQDIMAMIQAAGQGSEAPATIVIGEDDANGNTLWSEELDNAMVYQVQFPPMLSIRKAGEPHGDYLRVRFASLTPATVHGALTGRRSHGLLTLVGASVGIPGIQDPAGVTDISELTLTFPGAIAPPNPGGTAPGPTATATDLTFTTPSDIDDGYAEWLSSVVQNGTDVRQAALTYTFADGSTIEVDLNIQLNGLTYATTKNKNAGPAPAKFYRLVFRP